MDAVSLVRCDDYGKERTYSAVKKAVDLLGGIGHFVKPGMKVLVKPNILQASGPEQAVCTHPDIMYGICRVLKEHGCSVIVAESPGAGSLYGPAHLKKAYETTGYAPLAEELGIEFNLDVTYDEVANPNGKIIKRFLIIRPVGEVDAVVIVSKLKSHLFTGMTAATKNIFGLVPGMEKASFHGRLPDVKDFSDMLVDLNELVRPSLQIMDAIVAMEGDGPYSGEPRKLSAVLASGSYAAIDVVASRIIGIDPYELPTVTAALERGVLSSLDDIEVRGGDPMDFAVTDFKLPATFKRERGGISGRLMLGMSHLAKIYALRPVVIKDRCVGCERCIIACPVKTIYLRGGKAKVKQSKCIKCYTCHEMCTSNAIELKRSPGGRLAAFILERKSTKRG